MKHDPVMLIRIGELNLSDRASPRHLRLRHTERADGGKELEVAIANVDLELIDDPNIQEGQNVTWRFGYVDELSPLYTGRAYEVEPTFDTRRGTTLIVRVYDAIAEMRAAVRNTTWRAVNEGEAKITESEIVEMIAAEYGYNIDSEETALYFSEIAQAEYDWDFIQNELTRTAVARDPNKPDPYRAWFSADGTLNFKPTPLHNAPKKVYRFVTENDDPVLLNFRVKSKGYRPGKTAANTTEVADVGPGTEASSTADNETSSRTSMGRRVINGVTGKDWTESAENPGELEPDPNVADPIHTEEHTAAAARVARNEAEQEALEALASVLGDPTVQANDVVEFLNLGAKYSGPYLVEEVVHQIDRGGFVTDLSLSKNALRSAPSEGTAGDRTEDAGGSEVGSSPESTNERREISGVTGGPR